MQLCHSDLYNLITIKTFSMEASSDMCILLMASTLHLVSITAASHESQQKTNEMDLFIVPLYSLLIADVDTYNNKYGCMCV